MPFESKEESSLCSQFFLEVLCHFLARQMNSSCGETFMNSTVTAQGPMELAESMVLQVGWQSCLAGGDQLDLSNLLPQDLAGPDLGTGLVDFLNVMVNDISDGLLISDEGDDDDSLLALSGRVAKPHPPMATSAGEDNLSSPVLDLCKHTTAKPKGPVMTGKSCLSEEDE